MDLGLKNRRILITGGSKGIGAATAKVMAQSGARLVLVARNAEALAEECKALVAGGAIEAQWHSCDLSHEDAITDLASRYPDIDVLVNNAGDMPPGDIFAVDDRQWRLGWDSKVFAYIRMCRAYYPLMKARGGGVIVNLSGIGAQLHRWDYICSGMGNQAMEFLTRTLGAHSPQDNIRVVCVSPGAVATDRQERIMADWFGSDAPQPLWPFERRATPEEIANTIAFLASERSSYTSGSVHVVDGGASISRVV